MGRQTTSYPHVAKLLMFALKTGLTKSWIMVVIEVNGMYSFFCVYRAGATFLRAFIYITRLKTIKDTKDYGNKVLPRNSPRRKSRALSP